MQNTQIRLTEAWTTTNDQGLETTYTPSAQRYSNCQCIDAHTSWVEDDGQSVGSSGEIMVPLFATREYVEAKDNGRGGREWF